MSHELVTALMFSTLMVLLLTGQRVFGAIGFVGTAAALLLWGDGGSEMPFNASFQVLNCYPLLTVPLFVYMGYVLSESGIADDLYRMFHVWMGPLPGGLAIGTVGLMVLISTMNGLSVAGMAIGASVALPEMLRRGYDKVMVTGVIQAGSSLGILIPPSVVLVLYAMIARQPVLQLWLAGILPGLIMAALFTLYIGLRIKPSLDAFNQVANGEMVIDLYTADQLVSQGELFRAVQNGTIDAAQSDDDSMASPVDVAIFGAYFPFASRYSLDVPVLWEWMGLKEIWEEAYGEVENVTWLSTGSWDPCNFATTRPIHSLADLQGLRVYTFPTGGRFMQRLGVVPVTLPYEDVQVAVQTGELDGVCWSGITEDYTVGWADVTKYYLTDNISGAWAGSYFVNTEKWEAVPDRLKTLFRLCIDSSHYYRQHWYWWGEAHYRATGGKLELTSIPEAEWQKVEDEALKFWDEIAQNSPRSAKVVQILKDYSARMKQVGPPYRYG